MRHNSRALGNAGEIPRRFQDRRAINRGWRRYVMATHGQLPGQVSAATTVLTRGDERAGALRDTMSERASMPSPAI
jgi:hypothetical protein